MIAQTEPVPGHQVCKPPSDGEVRSFLGPAWDRYRTALRGLAALELTPEFYRYGPSGGWALRFEVDNATGCALYLAKSLVGLVAISPRAESVLREDPESDEQMRLLVAATPRRGKTRWVQIPLRTQEDVRRFLTLVAVQVNARRTSGTAKAARTSKTLSHKPRRRTTAAGGGRKKTGTPPRRSAARRNNRG